MAAVDLIALACSNIEGKQQNIGSQWLKSKITN